MKLTNKQIRIIIGLLRAIIELFTDLIKEEKEKEKKSEE